MYIINFYEVILVDFQGVSVSHKPGSCPMRHHYKVFSANSHFTAKLFLMVINVVEFVYILNYVLNEKITIKRDKIIIIQVDRWQSAQ